jgi:hypothetical protein
MRKAGLLSERRDDLGFGIYGGEYDRGNVDIIMYCLCTIYDVVEGTWVYQRDETK